MTSQRRDRCQRVLAQRAFPFVVAAALAVVAPRTTIAQSNAAMAPEPFPGLDDYIGNAVKTWGVPGLSVAIVRNDSVIYTRGFGTRSVSDLAPVDDQTLFELGSTTKAFTSTLAAMLVADGKLRWTDRMGDLLPEFRLADPAANEAATIRDALSHQTGVGRAELMWLGADASREELIHRLRFLKPESPFRSYFSYQNVMYVAAGEALARVGGGSWDDLVRQRIFSPLGMASTVANGRESAGANAARPHGMSGNAAYVQAPFNSHKIGPAGSIVSNARDMTQWLRFHLEDGVVDGKRLVSTTALAEVHGPQVLMATGAAARGGAATGPPLTNFSAYGMGWIVKDYRHQLVWQHSGGTLGMTAQVSMLPEQRFGVVVLSNMGSAALPAILGDYILDRQLGAPVGDPSGDAYARSVVQRRRADSLEKVQSAAHPASVAPPLPLTAYTGTFTDSLYGDAAVSIVDGQLHLTRGLWSGPLQYWNATNFRWTVVPATPAGPLFIKFEVSPAGAVTGLYFGLPGDVSLMTRKSAARGGGAQGSR